ncbi:MAG: TIGR04013 family B12-binding domain/radical SAM domain-containing protein [Methanoregula sp.]|jgi:B12-binding domain/radical SAM domain protein|nr:TIGR04013 family B12-binding domain/radical SAM domain-containing protein [Methanoregula sp.]
MEVNWRQIHAARNTYAVLSAACEQDGFILHPVDRPADDITCYSLNTINESEYRDEISSSESITIVGGPHASACPRQVAEYADYVIIGEGEFTLPRLLDKIERGIDAKIPGVATVDYFRPADTCIFLDKYPAFSKTQGFVEISRGCPFSCGYCQTPQIFGHCMRHRSIDAIAEYANRYEHARFVSPNAFAYGSDGIHPRYAKVEKLFSHLKNSIYFGTFPSEVRPEFICEESLSLLERYCSNTKLHFGAQSGSDTVLESLNRGHTVEDVILAVELCKEFSITPVVDFIVGIPFETDEDQGLTLDLMQWVARYGQVHLHRFMPLPGTPLAGTNARSLLPETEKICGKLALSGKLTGSWHDPEIRFFRHPSNDIP